MKKDNDWKSRLGMVYSTNPDFEFETDEEEEAATLPPSQQKLRVAIERKTGAVRWLLLSQDSQAPKMT